MTSRISRLALAAALAAMAMAGSALAQGAPAPAAGTAPTNGGGGGPVGDPAAGEAIYFESCEMCHGADGKGGRGGGVPFTETLSAKDIVTISTTGRNAMPAFETIYSDQDLHDVAAFITEKLIGAK